MKKYVDKTENRYFSKKNSFVQLLKDCNFKTFAYEKAMKDLK
jgi:hypothetical protein